MSSDSTASEARKELGIEDSDIKNARRYASREKVLRYVLAAFLMYLGFISGLAVGVWQSQQSNSNYPYSILPATAMVAAKASHKRFYLIVAVVSFILFLIPASSASVIMYNAFRRAQVF